MLHSIRRSMWHMHFRNFSVGSKGLRISLKDLISHNFLRFLQAEIAGFNSAKYTSFYLSFVEVR